MKVCTYPCQWVRGEPLTTVLPSLRITFASLRRHSHHYTTAEGHLSCVPKNNEVGSHFGYHLVHLADSEAEWRLMSTNPDTMVGKVFSLSNECGSNEDMVYNISSHHFKKELMKSDSPVGSIDMSEQELAQMNQGNYIV
jgi:hypothetical protein